MKPFYLKRFFAVRLCLHIFFAMFAWQQAQAQVSLTTDQTTLKAVIQRIKSKTKYRFFYSDDLGKQRVNAVSVLDKPITHVLDRLLENTGIDYKIIDNIVYLKRESLGTERPSDVDTGNEAHETYTFYGQIRDVSGNPLIGATVKVKGEKIYAIADLDGNFVLTSNSPRHTLIFSCVGFDTIEKNVDFKRKMTVVMKENLYEMGDVVVTAMGIGRSQRALNYYVKRLEGNDVNTAKTTNIANSLNGKFAGATINESAAGMGGAARIVMRGPKSLAQSNQPLYVIDGMPINNRSNDEIKAGIYSLQPGSEGIADINPDDIESISVLSGPAASALYGSAAAQGAVMIKTKSGRVGKLSVELSTSTQFYTPFVLPDFQTEYVNRPAEMKSWGERKATSFKRSATDIFFRGGVNVMNNLTLSTGTEQSQTYISAGTMNTRGIVPNNDSRRYNVTFKNVTSAFADKMRVTFSLKYIREFDRNLLAQGQYFNPLTSVYLFPRGEDFMSVKDFEKYDDARGIYIQNWIYGDDLKMQNPYWVSNRMVRTTNRNRYMSDFGVKYNVSKWLALESRLRWDEAVNKQEDKRFASTLDIFAHSPYGYYSYSKTDDRALYGDLMADVSKRWLGLDISANLGAALSYTVYDISGFQGGLKAPSNVFTPNAIDYEKASGDNRPVYAVTRHAISSLFGSVEMGWKNKVYFTFTGRTDWDSALSNTARQSFFYPSAGVSAVISELVRLPKFISYLKWRSSWASVGSAISPNISSRWRYEYVPSTGTYKTVTYKFPETFYPERTNSWEAGFTAHFFDKALTMDVTLYQSNTKNQTFLRSITIGGEYDHEYIQTGNVRNRGLELSIGYSKRWTEMSWEVNMNYSMNRNKIVKLLDNPDEVLRQGGLSGCEIILTQGGTMGDMYTFTDFRRDNQGNILLNDDKQVMQAELSTPQYLGSILPKGNIGLGNKVSWKGLELSILLTARLGGICVSQTQAFMDSYGVSKKTADLRNHGGVQVGDKLVSTEKYYSVVGGETPVWSEYVYSATNVRIQEACLSYTFGKIIRGATITLGLTARNLLMLYKKAPFDPELAPSTDIYYQGFDYFMQPSQRSMGFNIHAKF